MSIFFAGLNRIRVGVMRAFEIAAAPWLGGIAPAQQD